MIAVESDVEIIESLEFEPSIGCEVLSVEGRCQQEATWLCRCRLCGWSVATCDEHKAVFLRSATNRAVVIECGGCGQRRTRCEDIVDFVPIGRAS